MSVTLAPVQRVDIVGVLQGQLDDRQQRCRDLLARLLVGALERKHRLEDNSVGKTDLQLAPLDPGQQRGCLRGELRMVLAQVTEDDVRVQKG